MTRGSMLVVLAFLAACQSQETAPPLTCATRDQCPTGTLCDEAAGVCIPERACATQAECCPGLRCIAGTCRPFDECSQALGCTAQDQTCDNGVCVSTTCGAGGTCQSSRHACIAGRCLDAVPCGGCGAQTVCEPVTGRCLPAGPACQTTCAPGSVALVTNGIELRRPTCDLGAVACACVALPPLEPVVPGGYLSAVRIGGQVAVVGQDLRYGDVVVARLGGATTAVLGVPDGPVVGDPTGPRGGVAAPGPNVGRYVRATPYRDGLVLIAHDEPNQAAIVAVTDAADHVVGTATLSSADRSGLGGSITTLPSGVVVAAWFTARPTGAVELSVGTVPPSGSPAEVNDWTITTIGSATGVAKSPAPCGADCGTLEACLVGQATETGQTTYTCTAPDLAPTCEPACDRDALCAGAACARIARRDTDRTGLDGPGPESALAAFGEQPLLVAYSPRAGAIELWSKPDGSWTRTRLDGGGGANAGAAPALAANASRVVVAYEADSPRRVVVQFGVEPSALTPAPISALGGRDPDVAIDANGRLVAVWGEAEGRGLVYASEQLGWASTPLGDGPNVGRTNALLVDGSGSRIVTVEDKVTSRGLSFELVELPAP